MYSRSLLGFSGKCLNSLRNLSTTSSPRFKSSLMSVLNAHAARNRITLQRIELGDEFTANNFMSEIYRCTVSGVKTHENGARTSYKATYRLKQMPRDEGYVKRTGCDIAFFNEKFAYEWIWPGLTPHLTRPVVIPEYIGSTDSILVVEDLSESGYRAVPTQELNLRVAKKMIETLANFHAASLIMKHKESRNFEDISNHVLEVNFKTNNDRFDFIFESQEKRIEIARLLVDDFRHQYQMDKLRNTTKERTMHLLKNRHEFCVINHGDPTVTNMLCKKGNGGETIALLDFQMTRYASFAADLIYFLFVSLHPDLLEAHKAELGKHYFRQLQSNISGLPCAEKLTSDFVKTELEFFAFFGFIHALWTLPVQMGHHVGFEHKVVENLKQFETKSAEEEVATMPDVMKERIRKIVRCYVNIVAPIEPLNAHQ